VICERFHRDPEDDTPCIRCGGHGFNRWFDVDLGYVYEECAVCGAVATAGDFVIQVATARFHYELNRHGKDFVRARQRAARAAELLAARNGSSPGGRVIEVRVIFKPQDTTLREEVVAAVSVRVPSWA